MITGALRVKNEARWIERVIASILPLCDRVVVFDDHSTDGTPAACGLMRRTTIVHSPFSGLNEARDKNYLLDKVRDSDWILWIDGDELLEPSSIAALTTGFPCSVLQTTAQCISFRIKYLWNDEHTVRTDGVYGNFRRQSMFRPGRARFSERGAGPNFHCGNAPQSLWSRCAYPDVSLLHLGYLNREDRIRKYEWYRSVDPNNMREDGYRHVVVGDLFPADSQFKHGGPLKLEALKVQPHTDKAAR